MKNRLTKYLLLSIFAFVLLSCSSVQNSGPEIKHQTGFMWKVTSGDATVWLLGSIHTAKAELYPLPEEIETAYQKADSLVVEVNINDLDPMAMVARAMYTDGTLLKDHLKEKTWTELELVLKEYNVPEMAYATAKPWFAGLMLMQFALQQKGYDPNMGVDKHFLDLAKDKKGILELESLEFQLNMLENMSKDPDSFIEYSLKDLDILFEQVEKMFKAWDKGDIDLMTKLIVDARKDDPEHEDLYKILLDDRNITMTNKIKEYLKTDKTYFLVVGAGHLIGEKGILNLLK
jgi:uncharacterized protein YbaP (TraB family)